MPQVQVIPPILEQAKKIKVAAYARVSSDSVDQLNSFSSQVEYYTDYIQSKEEWEFAGLYADEAVTGTTTEKRSDFQRLLADCHAGKINRILVKSISRFARNTLDCIQTVRELKQLGIAVEFEKENIDTGSLGSEMLLSILGAAAQEESLSISKNLKWSYRRRMRSGDFTTHSAPFGYFFEDKTLVPNPQETPIVEYIFNSYLAGKSMDEIARDLTAKEKGSGSRKGASWRRTTIQYILTNEKYIGDSLVQKKFTPDVIPLRKVKNQGQLPQYYIWNSHPPLIERETFEKVQELIRQKTEQYAAKKSSQVFPLSRMVKCGLCGSTFQRRPSKEKIQWSCYHHLQNRELCSMGTVCETEIYQAFAQMYYKLMDNRHSVLNPMLMQLEELKEKSLFSRPEVMDLNRKISELAKQNHSLARLQAKGCMDSAVFIERSNRNNRKIEKLRLQLVKLQGSDHISETIENTQLLVKLMDQEKSMLEFDPFIFKMMIRQITVLHDKFCFELINGLVLEEGRETL